MVIHIVSHKVGESDMKPHFQKQCSQSHCTQLVLWRLQCPSVVYFTWLSLPTPNTPDTTAEPSWMPGGPIPKDTSSPSTHCCCLWKLHLLLPALAPPNGFLVALLPCSSSFRCQVWCRCIWLGEPATWAHTLESRDIGNIPSSIFSFYSRRWAKGKKKHPHQRSKRVCGRVESIRIGLRWQTSPVGRWVP